MEIKIKQCLSAALKSLLKGLALLQCGLIGDLPPITAPERALAWLSVARGGCRASPWVAGLDSLSLHHSPNQSMQGAKPGRAGLHQAHCCPETSGRVVLEACEVPGLLQARDRDHPQTGKATEHWTLLVSLGCASCEQPHGGTTGGCFCRPHPAACSWQWEAAGIGAVT